MYMVYLAKPLKLIKFNAAQFGNVHDLRSVWLADIGCLFGKNHFTSNLGFEVHRFSEVTLQIKHK